MAALSALNRTRASDDASDETAVRLGRLFQRENVNWLDMDFSFWGRCRTTAPRSTPSATLSSGGTRCRSSTSTPEGNRTERTVEPAQLMFKESSWYPGAWCRERDAWRMFKLCSASTGKRWISCRKRSKRASCLHSDEGSRHERRRCAGDALRRAGRVDASARSSRPETIARERPTAAGS